MTAETPRHDDPRSIRLAHLRAEAGIKAVGQLCYIVAFLGLLGVLEFILIATGVLEHPRSLDEAVSPAIVRLLFWSMAGFMLLVAIAHWALGRGLVRLRSWARWTVVALTALSLVSTVGFGVGLCLEYPIGGLLVLLIGGALHAMILLPLLTTEAGVVFSPRYQDVIRATPEIRSRMHWVLKACLALMLAGVMGLVAYLAAIYLRIID